MTHGTGRGDDPNQGYDKSTFLTMNRPPPDPAELDWESLSPQELACLRGAAEHKRPVQIGDELGLTAGTVETYLTRARQKLGLTNRKAALEAFAAVYINPQSTNQDFDTPPKAGLSTVLERLPWPFPTRGRRTNTMTGAETVVAIIVAAALMLAVASLYLLALALVNNARDRGAFALHQPRATGSTLES